MKVVALVTDLADRSMIGDGVQFVRSPAQLREVDADLVLVDLNVPGALDVIPSGVRVIAYGPHVETELLAVAAERGAEAWPRSRFFREAPWRAEAVSPRRPDANRHR
jgi:hypothetical protein